MNNNYNSKVEKRRLFIVIVVVVLLAQIEIKATLINLCCCGEIQIVVLQRSIVSDPLLII